MRSFSAFTRSFSHRLRFSRDAILLMFLCVFGAGQSAVAQGSDHVGQVVVHVRDRRTENALDRVRVQVVRFPQDIVSEQFTGGDGGVQFSGIGIGEYIIRVTRQGYQPAEARVDFRKGDSTVQNVDIPLLPLDQDGKGGPGSTISVDNLRIPENAKKEFERGKRLLTEKKNPQESIGAFQRAIELYPEYPDAYFLMGTAQMQLNDPPAAEASFRKAIALDAHRTAPYYPLAMLLFGQGHFDDEQKLLLEAQKQDAADWRWPFELARCEAQQGRWETALQYGVETSKKASAPPRIHLLLADIYSNSDKPREAVAELELFAQLDPKSPYMSRVREVLPALRQRAAAPSSSNPR
jgi:tetratricopeptide (TPR) repeat protein